MEACLVFLLPTISHVITRLQVLAMIGDQLDFGDSVCGAVLSIRFGEDILSIWNRNASDNQVQRQFRPHNFFSYRGHFPCYLSSCISLCSYNAFIFSYHSLYASRPL